MAKSLEQENAQLKKQLSSVKRVGQKQLDELQSRIEDLELENAGILERAKLGELAAMQSIGYAQAARAAIEEFGDKLVAQIASLTEEVKKLKQP